VSVLAFWAKQLNNYGDKMTPWLVEKITGSPAQYVEAADRRRKLVGVGSILRLARHPSVVWGTGIKSKSEAIDSRVQCVAVRGPLSAQAIWSSGGKPPQVFGDPGLLLPRWIPRREQRYKLGVVPHYVHFETARIHFERSEDVAVVDLRGSVENVTRQITACAAIASSSLHGLVTACAYGIPHVRLTFPQPIGGDGSKFADFYQGIGAGLPQTLDCAKAVPSVEAILGSVTEAPAVDTSELWRVCPVKEMETTTC
jgi:pyruvyltransferase